MANEIKLNSQTCPICGQYIKFSSRYPNYICEKCFRLATDDDGEPVYLFDKEFSGHGCAGRYTETDKQYHSNLCYIKGIGCNAEEAYFGGILLLAL